MAPPTEGETPPGSEKDMNSDSQGQSATNLVNGASGMDTSGPTGMAANGERPWERTWTIDEMRKGAKDWSLAGDAGLLHFLQDFSQNMISRTHEIEDQVNKLVNEAKHTGVRVNNAFNDFIMLANTQFVENRVYDEDVSQEESAEAEKKQEEKEKTREQREAELIPKISEAMRLGLNVIETAFEKLDVNEANSDSEDDDTPYRTDPLLEPKDPYIHRALPYIIGSPGFLQDDDVGLVDVLSDVEEDEDHGSLSESESESSTSESEEDSEEETSSDDSFEEKPQKQRTMSHKKNLMESDESDDNSDLFGDKPSDKEERFSDSSSEEEIKETKPAGPKDFSAELASKLGGGLPSNQKAEAEDQSEDDEEYHETKQKASKKKKKKKDEKRDSKHKKISESDDLFGPPPDDDYMDDDSPFSKKGGLFSSGGGLFDDDGDEGGLFDDAIVEETSSKKKQEKQKVLDSDESEEETKQEEKSRPRTKSGRNVPVGGVSIFGGGDDDLFSSSLSKDEDRSTAQNKTTKSSSSQAKPTKPSGGGGGLFDDDDEEDLFASMAPKKTEKKESKPVSKPASSLFDDDEDDGDLFAEATKSQSKTSVTANTTQQKGLDEDVKPKKKLPPGAVSMFGGAPNPLAAAIKAQRQKSESEEDDDDDEFSEGEKSQKSSSSVTASSLGAHKPNPGLSGSNSSNSLFVDEPDDLFASKTTKETKPASSQPVSKKPSAFFDDDDDDDDGDLFSTMSKPSKSTDKPSGTTKPKSASLLFEDDEEDLFAGNSQAASPKKKPVGGVALFGGQPLFGDATSPVKEKPSSPEVVPKAAATRQKNKSISLFDDNDEGDGGDLFGGGDIGSTSQKPKSSNVPIPTQKTKSMFDDDDDDLFGGDSKNEEPSVDLFGASSPLKTPPVAAPVEKKTSQPKTSKAVSSKKTTGGGGLFGGDDDDDDDLFAAASKATIKKVQPPKQTVKTKPLDGATTTASSTDPLVGDDNDDLFSSKPKTSVKASPKPAIQEKKIAVGGATTDESSSDLFGSKEDQDEPLFGASKPKEEPAPPSFKKPAGAVSMFGGMDPTALLKKKSGIGKSEASPEPKETKEQKEETIPEKDLSTSPAEDDQIFSKPSAFKPSQIKAGSGIGGLASNLAINPAALLPGAAPPLKEEKPAAVTFDQPAEVKTLSSLQKGRAKMQGGRRPPSRKGRSSAKPSSEQVNENKQVVTPTSQTKLSGDLFGNDDLFKDESARTKPQEPKVTKSEPISGNEDLFSSPPADLSFPVKKEKKTLEKDPLEDDIFNVDKNKPEKESSSDMFSSTKSSKKEKSDSLGLGEEDDLFGSSLKPKIKKESSKDSKSKPVEDYKTGPPTLPPDFDDDDDIFSTKTKKKEKSALDFDDDEDDIFGNSSVLMQKGSSKTKQQKPDMFAASLDREPPPMDIGDDDDDIFASSKVEKTTKSSKKNEDTSKPKPDPLDDDDIFAAAAPVKKVKKSKTKDEDLFTDKTDIFADLPPSKPKEKKTKKKAAATGGSSIFKDDVDDIFADVATKPKTKKTSTQKKKTTAKQEEENIFDDPLSALTK